MHLPEAAPAPEHHQPALVSKTTHPKIPCLYLSGTLLYLPTGIHAGILTITTEEMP
jgi:hypothetical protein